MQQRTALYTISALLCLLTLLSGCGRKGKDNTPSPVTGTTVLITDMAGRQVRVPSNITKVFCSDETCTFFMYSLAPDRLVARNSPCSDNEKQFTTQRFQQLPVLGRIFSGKSEILSEELIRIKPDVLLCPLFEFTTPEYIKSFEDAGKLTGIPVVVISLDFHKLPDTYLFMGKLLNYVDSAAVLSAYCRETLDWADNFRKKIKKPVSVYVAEGNKGLQTIPAESTHSETLALAGLINSAQVDESYGYKEISIDFEQLLNWNPDWILLNSRSRNHSDTNLKSYLIHDKRWNKLEAVRSGKLLEIPNAPFNWIGRPPGINRLIGVRWLTSVLYPDLSDIDIIKEVIRFYALFYHLDLTVEQANILLNKPAK